MAKVTIVSVSEDQNTVTLSNGLVLKASEAESLDCHGCFFAEKMVSCRGFDLCVPSNRKDNETKIFVIDESKIEPLEVVVDGRKFTAENTADAKWLKERFEKPVEEK